MKRWIAILLMLVLISVLVMGLLSAAKAETMVCTLDARHYVNVRTSPSTDAATYGRTVHGGDEIEILSVGEDGWLTIDYNGVNAYVQAKFFESAVNANYTVEANGRVRWRSSPGGKVGGYYQPGEVVTVDATCYGSKGVKWARIGERYVDMAFLVPYETEDEKEFYGE